MLEDYVPKGDYDPENLPEHHRFSYKRRITAILSLGFRSCWDYRGVWGILRHLSPMQHICLNNFEYNYVIDLRIMSSDGFSWVILRMALKLNGAADQRSWGICRMTGAKSLVVLFAHMLFGQRQLHGKQGIYVQFLRQFAALNYLDSLIRSLKYVSRWCLAFVFWTNARQCSACLAKDQPNTDDYIDVLPAQRMQFHFSMHVARLSSYHILINFATFFGNYGVHDYASRFYLAPSPRYSGSGSCTWTAQFGHSGRWLLGHVPFGHATWSVANLWPAFCLVNVVPRRLSNGAKWCCMRHIQIYINDLTFVWAVGTHGSLV